MSMTCACDSSPSSCLIRPSMKPCCSRAAWYSAFSFRSPCARASAIALITAGRLTDLSSSSSARRRCAPWVVSGALIASSTLDAVPAAPRPGRCHDIPENAARPGAGNGGRIGRALLQRLAPDRERVGDRLAALGGVDDVGDLAVLDQVDDVRTAFGHLVDVRALQAVLAQPGGGAAGGHQRPAALDQFARNRQHARLVRVAHGDERLADRRRADAGRSEEHTSELQSLMRISYAVFCLTKKN